MELKQDCGSLGAEGRCRVIAYEGDQHRPTCQCCRAMQHQLMHFRAAPIRNTMLLPSTCSRPQLWPLRSTEAGTGNRSSSETPRPRSAACALAACPLCQREPPGSI